jgi:hypothetical protein
MDLWIRILTLLSAMIGLAHSAIPLPPSIRGPTRVP